MSPFAQSMLCLMNSGPPALRVSKIVRTRPIPLRAGMVPAILMPGEPGGESAEADGPRNHDQCCQLKAGRNAH